MTDISDMPVYSTFNWFEKAVFHFILCFQWPGQDDVSVYTGTAGLALMNWQKYKTLRVENALWVKSSQCLVLKY